MLRRSFYLVSLILIISSCTDSSKYFENLFEEKSYHEIIYFYESNVEKYKADPKVLGFVAKSYFQLENYKTSIKFYEKASDLNPYEPLYYSDKGLAYYELGEYSKAIISCDRAIEVQPDYGFAYINRSAAYIGMKKWNWALEDLSKAMKTNLKKEDQAFIYANLSTIYTNTNKYEEALENASLAIELNKEILWAYRNRAFIYMFKNAASKAMDDIDSGLQIDANDPDLLMYKGMITIKVDKEVDEGCNYFKLAIDEFRRRNDSRLKDQISIVEKYCK